MRPIHLTLLTLAVFLCCRTTRAKTNLVDVGGALIVIPSPEGFFRYDGKNPKVDNLEQSLLPANNRLLATFGSEENLADVLVGRFPKIDRHFNAQSLRSLESLVVTQAFFNDIKTEVRNNIAALFEKNHDIIQQVETNASSAISKESHLSINLKFGEMVSLGVFDETADSLCFSALEKVQVSSVPDSYVTIVACSLTKVRNRMVYLYSGSRYRNRSDIEWARRSVQRWRDAVLKANSH